MHRIVPRHFLARAPPVPPVSSLCVSTLRRSVSCAPPALVHLDPRYVPSDPEFLHPMEPRWADFPGGNNELMCSLDIASAKTEINCQHITVTDLAQACYRRAAVLKTSYGFFHAIYEDAEIPQDSSLPGYGIIATVKDLGLPHVPGPQREGSVLHLDNTARITHDIVSHLQQQGVVFVAQTSCSEFGLTASGNNGLVGVVRNPFNPHLTTGGSSGGSAGAVASKVGHISIAIDAAGSIRIPASFCGCVGIKPQSTLDVTGTSVVSQFGYKHAAAGIVARSVLDSATTLDLLTSPTSNLSTLAHATKEWGGVWTAGEWWPRLKIAAIPNSRYMPTEQPVLNAFQKAITRAMRTLSIVPLSEEQGAFYPEDPDPYMRTFWSTRAKDRATWSTREHARIHQQDVQASEALLSPHVQQALGEPPIADYMTAHSFLTTQCLVPKLMEEYDVILTPTVPVLPWEADKQGPASHFTTNWNCFTYPANMLNLAAGTLNCGWYTSKDGRYCIPIGMQVMVADRGVPYQNLHTLVRVMAALERCFAHVNTEGTKFQGASQFGEPEIVNLGFHDGWADRQRMTFMAAMYAGANIVAADRADDVAPGLVYEWRKSKFSTPYGIFAALTAHTVTITVDYYWLPVNYCETAYGMDWLKAGMVPAAFARIPAMQVVLLPINGTYGRDDEVSRMIASDGHHVTRAGLSMERIPYEDARMVHPLIVATEAWAHAAKTPGTVEWMDVAAATPHVQRYLLERMSPPRACWGFLAIARADTDWRASVRALLT